MEDAVAELKPNSQKILFQTFIKIVGILALVLLIAFVLNSFVDFSIFETVASEFGLQLGFLGLIVPALAVALAIIAVILLLEYYALSKIRYVFRQDGFNYYQNFLIMQLSELFIPYKNIVKVTFEKISWLNTGNIIVELTAMEPRSIELKFIDNAEQVSSDILKLINQYRSTYYAKKTEEYKYNKILDREPF